MRPSTETREDFAPLAGPAGLHRAQAALGEAGGPLHKLDYEDLALTGPGMRLVRRAALDVMRRFGAVDERELPLGRALALFLDHVFWEEKSGGLILCADFPDQSFCLPIPRGLWGLAARAGRVQ
ncbi:MAG: hypothetical protein AB7E46_00835 [Desulfovibrio sp.]|jgi:hypothetical protein